MASPSSTTTPTILSLNILGRVVGLDNKFLGEIASVLDGLITRPVSAPAPAAVTTTSSPYAGFTPISSLFTLLKLFTEKINESTVTETVATAPAEAETARKKTPAKPDDSENRERFIRRYKDTFEQDTLGYILDSCGEDKNTMSSRMNHLAALERGLGELQREKKPFWKIFTSELRYHRSRQQQLIRKFLNDTGMAPNTPINLRKP